MQPGTHWSQGDSDNSDLEWNSPKNQEGPSRIMLEEQAKNAIPTNEKI